MGDPAGWVPLEYQSPFGYQVCAEIHHGAVCGARAALSDVRDLAEQWARNIQDQGWLARGQPPAAP